MSSTILYKFRSGTSFEPLPLPGTSARLFDIKRAIIRAKKLDSSSTNTTLEFDLSIQNANTNEIYDDESMILPRGTRIVVRRVAAERGRGILSRMAQGGTGAQVINTGATLGSGVQDGFYTYRSRDRDAEDDFFVDAPQAQAGVVQADVDESKELEALKAVTDQAGNMYGGGNNSITGGASVQQKRGGARDPRLAGQGPPPQFAKPPPGGPNSNSRFRPNADPELRQQELKDMSAMQPKKRATGIPRTFLNLNAAANPAAATDEGVDGGGEMGEGGTEGELANKLQPSAQAFQALVRSGGGQSLSSASKRRDLDYALKLTATTIPDHLQCGICHSIVRNAMLVPWDTEGRPTCESCIRDGLTNNGFTCPLTGMEGVSPDDLFPNVGLRKAADMFVSEVMDKMDSIERQIEAEEEEEEKKRAEMAAAAAAKGNKDEEFEDGGDGILTKRTKLNGNKNKSSSTNDDVLFGGDDEFGGDVFDVAESDKEEEDEPEDTDEIIEPNTKTVTKEESGGGTTESVDNKGGAGDGGTSTDNNVNDNLLSQKSDGSANAASAANDTKLKKEDDGSTLTPSPSKTSSTADSRSSSGAKKAAPVKRGPPAGYLLGPAGSSGVPAAVPPPQPNHNNNPPMNMMNRTPTMSNGPNNMNNNIPPNMMGGQAPHNQQMGPSPRGPYMNNQGPPSGNNFGGGRGPNMHNQGPPNQGRPGNFGPNMMHNGPQGGGYFPNQGNPGNFPNQGPGNQNMGGRHPMGQGYGPAGPGFIAQYQQQQHRKRGHGDMMGGQQGGSPNMNMMHQGGGQGPNQGGNWGPGGRGGYPNQFGGGRGPPPGRFGGRGFQGRGGRGFQGWGGRGGRGR